jgi:hypothetical protein
VVGIVSYRFSSDNDRFKLDILTSDNMQINLEVVHGLYLELGVDVDGDKMWGRLHEADVLIKLLTKVLEPHFRFERHSDSLEIYLKRGGKDVKISVEPGKSIWVRIRVDEYETKRIMGSVANHYLEAINEWDLKKLEIIKYVAMYGLNPEKYVDFDLKKVHRAIKSTAVLRKVRKRSEVSRIFKTYSKALDDFAKKRITKVRDYYLFYFDGVKWYMWNKEKLFRVWIADLHPMTLGKIIYRELVEDLVARAREVSPDDSDVMLDLHSLYRTLCRQNINPRDVELPSWIIAKFIEFKLDS